MQCPNCDERLFFECLSCGWVRPGYRDDETDWTIYEDGTVTID